ncbi:MULTISPECIES: hypothetical protein [Neisseria]
MSSRGFYFCLKAAVYVYLNAVGMVKQRAKKCKFKIHCDF